MLPMHHRSMLNCLGLFKCSLSKRTTFYCVFPKGCVRTLLAPMQALSIVSMPPKPFRCMPRFPLITRVSYATTVCVLLPPDNQQNPCSATPLWKQKFDIGCTIYRRVVIRQPAVLEDKKISIISTFLFNFLKLVYVKNHLDTLVHQTANSELGKQARQRRSCVAKDWASSLII